MTYSVEIKSLDLKFGSFNVLKDLDLDIHDGEFLVLLGSSGCGKSTLLNCIAGLLEVSEGQIFINNRNVTWEEPSKRGIGMVFQSYALYPQMTVEGNLSFGLRQAGLPKDEVRRRVGEAAEILQITDLMKRKPSALSGGQRQRVAIGRALVRDVDVFLFDEPLSNLDAKLRANLRVELKRLHQSLKNTMIYVTHDQVEAMTLADRIAIMKDGFIQQLATPDEIYNRPVNKYVAGFIGSPSMNFLDGKLSDDLLVVGETKIDLTDYVFSSAQRRSDVFVGIRPEHVAFGEQISDAMLMIDANVDLYEPMGADTLVWTTLNGAPFHFRVDGQAKISRGQTVKIGLNPKQISLFDRETELRL